MAQQFSHVPVLLNEVLQAIDPHDGMQLLDGTLGGGGHSEALLEASGNSKLLGIDRDTAALKAAGERLARFGERFGSVHGNYKDVKAIAAQQGIAGFDGILVDMGVSSYQLDTPERGFSYHADAPLDMRMDQTQSFSAWNIVNEYDKRQLADVIKKYSDERWAGRIAEFIVNQRKKGSIDTTGQLVELITAAIPAAARRTGPHPARRTFQSLRIETNGELEGMEQAVTDMIELLNPGGRLAIITFHGTEDTLVKHAMRAQENRCICPRDLPVCACGRQPRGKMTPGKPIIPSPQECEENPRARSAKLRVFIRNDKPL